METEKDFQTEANEAGERFVEAARVLLETLRKAEEKEDEEVQDDITQEIEEYPLSVLVRSGWYVPGQNTEDNKPEEYEILLGTGGPASRIVGRLDEYLQPGTATFEYQDWFKPWTAAKLSGEQKGILLEFASHFWFGE
jgi:hypothetical protein